ncbi:MAG: enolase C-terminal domain-like protein [Nocardioidaceae bacterium]
MLGDRRIQRIETTQVQTRYPRTVGRNARLGSHGTGFATPAVQITLDDGTRGWGICEGGLPESLANFEGRDLAELFDPAIGVVAPEAIRLDLALHDVAARALGVSVHELLGDHGSSAVDLYSGAIYFDDLDPEDSPRGLNAVLENCAADGAAGFRAFKLKVGRGHRWMEREAGTARDIEVTRTVREAYPDARLLVDANNGWSPEQTIAFLEQVADCDLYWIEEPFHEEASGLRLLRDYLRESGSRTLIADGEADPDEAQLLDLARAGLIDVMLMDVCSYGLTAWRRVMPLLAELGVAGSPHAWGKPIKTLYAAQLAAGLGNVAIVEGVPGTTDGADTSRYALREGVLHVPAGPGFDLDLTAATAPATTLQGA